MDLLFAFSCERRTLKQLLSPFPLMVGGPTAKNNCDTVSLVALAFLASHRQYTLKICNKS